MDNDTIDPLVPSPPAIDPYAMVPPEAVPNVDDIVIEDGAIVESIFTEKQYRLLTEALYNSWTSPSGPFLALANVGLFHTYGQAPLAPDVMLSLEVRIRLDLTRKDNRSYFLWVIGKPPDVVIEFVSDRRGGEASYKKDEYARIGVAYYVIFDPQNRLQGGVLRAFALREKHYHPCDPSWLPDVGLGLKRWEGDYEGQTGHWLRWCEREGALVPTGGERTEQERQRTEQERQRAEQERQRAKQERQRAEQAEQRAEQERQRAEQERARAERLAAQLRDRGIEPEP